MSNLPCVTQNAGQTDVSLVVVVGVIATFLHVHPFGASIDYICSYLTRLEMKTRSSEIEDLLERLPSVFRQDFHGVGASLEKRWNFVGFDIKSKSVLS